ncbi:MAG: membrane protein insertase YidC [Hellea sp.]|nr:membrane protein insertase YidC [Hellea sp.]
MEDQKNFITFLLLSFLIMMGYWSFFGKKNVEQIQTEAAYEQQDAQIAAQSEPIVLQPREMVLNTGRRIEIETDSLSGSFLVEGSRFDDISLKKHKKTLEDDSENVVLLTPEGAEKAAYIQDNWAMVDSGSGSNSPWALESGSKLTATMPVVLSYQGDGFSVERTITIDDRYLITLSDRITNNTSDNLTLNRVGTAIQHGIPEGDGDARDISFILHQGAVAIVDGDKVQLKYKKFEDKRQVVNYGEAGWAGLTDKYWLSAAIAPQGTTISTEFRYRNQNNDKIFESGYKTEPMTLTSGTTVESKGFIFAGAKDRATLKSYEKDMGIDQLERAIDWGRLRLLTKPMNQALTFFYRILGNYGLAILALTTLIKLVLFPLFNKQYASQAKMKKVAPKQKKIQELYKDDRVRLQQEVMALYKKEGVNPLAGCLLIIPTIFVFFALYKTVFINVELRHAPFFGWIQDLSARDPLSIINLFGILPFDGMPGSFLNFFAIGPLAIIYGATMAMTFSLSSMGTAGGANSEMVQMQMKIFKWMPWVFMFILAPFATGLLVYWIWNNILSFGQQYYFTRKYGVDTPFDKFIGRFFGKPKADAS